MVVRERRRKTSRRTQYNTRRRMVRQTKRVKKRHSNHVKKRRRKTNMSNKMNRKKYKRTIRRQRLNQEGGMKKLFSSCFCKPPPVIVYNGTKPPDGTHPGCVVKSYSEDGGNRTGKKTAH